MTPVVHDGPSLVGPRSCTAGGNTPPDGACRRWLGLLALLIPAHDDLGKSKVATVQSESAIGSEIFLNVLMLHKSTLEVKYVRHFK